MIDNSLATRVFNDGEFIGAIEYYNRKCCLYAIDRNFFEVIYNPYSNEIENINQVLEFGMKKYLSRIRINVS